MDPRTRSLVLELLQKAHEGAGGALRSELGRLAAEEGEAVLLAMGNLRACLLDQIEGRLPAEAAEARIASLIHSHAGPEAAALMATYARLLVALLTESRDRLVSPPKHRGH